MLPLASSLTRLTIWITISIWVSPPVLAFGKNSAHNKLDCPRFVEKNTPGQFRRYFGSENVWTLAHPMTSEACTKQIASSKNGQISYSIKHSLVLDKYGFWPIWQESFRVARTYLSQGFRFFAAGPFGLSTTSRKATFDLEDGSVFQTAVFLDTGPCKRSALVSWTRVASGPLTAPGAAFLYLRPVNLSWENTIVEIIHATTSRVNFFISVNLDTTKLYRIEKLKVTKTSWFKSKKGNK